MAEYAVMVKSVGRILFDDATQIRINENISGLNFKKINEDIELFGYTPLSIDSIEHCKQLKSVLSEILDDRYRLLICDVMDIEQTVMDDKSIAKGMQLILHKPYPTFSFKTISVLFKRVFNYDIDKIKIIWNKSLKDGQSIIGVFHNELAELKLEQIKKFNSGRMEDLLITTRKV